MVKIPSGVVRRSAMRYAAHEHRDKSTSAKRHRYVARIDDGAARNVGPVRNCPAFVRWMVTSRPTRTIGTRRWRRCCYGRGVTALPSIAIGEPTCGSQYGHGMSVDMPRSVSAAARSLSSLAAVRLLARHERWPRRSPDRPRRASARSTIRQPSVTRPRARAPEATDEDDLPSGR